MEYLADKVRGSWLLAAIVVLLVGGCQEIADMGLPGLGDFSDHQSEPGDMSGTNWRAVDIAGYGRVAAAESSITFNKSDQLSGKTGCNTFLGPYRLEGDRVTFGPFAMTRMMCEPEIVPQEDAFLKALATAATMDVSGNAMTLRDGSGNVVMSMALIE
jgi:heat shock protein HslJ